MNKNYLKLFITAVVFLPLLMFGLDSVFNFSNFVNFMLAVVNVACIVVTGAAAFDGKQSFKLEPTDKPAGGLRMLRAFIIILSLILILPWNGGKQMYNSSVALGYQYDQKVQEKPMFYDAMWKTYTAKKDIVNMSVETFTKIATIMMNARTDGQAVTWKWVHENTQIPFGEFMDMYKDLSAYIESKRDSYLALERECQVIAQNHNTLIHQFPNNVYNIFIGRDDIEYKYGFTSDSTNKVFLTRKE